MRIGLIGIEFVGRGHLDQYIQLKKENSDNELVAIASDHWAMNGKDLSFSIGYRADFEK